MKVKAVKLKVSSVNLGSISAEAVVGYFAPKVEEAFRNEIGPHYVDHAKSLAPVSKKAPSKSPRKSSFKPVQLIKAVPAGRNIGDKVKRLKQLRENQVEVDVTSDAEFFEGTGEQDNEKKGEMTKGITPDKLAFQSGTVKGAFQHKPGTLRDSIHIDGVTRAGNQVILRVVASAPYALYVHEGFLNRKKTRMAPQKFFKKALPAIRDRLKNPNSYR